MSMLTSESLEMIRKIKLEAYMYILFSDGILALHTFTGTIM